MSVGEAPNRRPSTLGRYELITQIGQGGMAEVQLALQRGPAGFEKLVVVKLVHANLATQKGFVEMLLDEARIAALVKHPNVVDIYDLGEADGRYFIAMEYLEGEPLLAVLRAGREGKRLDPLSTARLIADTAEGLDAAHELRSMGGDPIELVHHDVSLGNIVVLYNGQVKLVDFGVAKASMSSASQAKIQGKFSYMAPEKLKGGPGDRRSDIWSLGVVLWEALTLRRLFKGGNDADTMKQVLEQNIPGPSSVNGEVLADFDAIVLKALERDPDKRYGTAKAMAQDLEEVLRKQGYGGRNDQIAKYMQATFESHINARKKLLQEVSSKGRASAAVLEAAFAEPVPDPIRTSGEFSIAFRTPPAEGTPSNPRLPKPTSVPPPKRALPPPLGTPTHPIPNAVPLIAPSVDTGATLIDAPTFSDDLAKKEGNDEVAEAVARLRGDAEDTLSTEVNPVVPRPGIQSTPPDKPADHRRLYLGLGAIAAALVIIIIVAVVIASGKKSDDDKLAGATPDAKLPVIEQPEAAVETPDAAEAPVDVAAAPVDEEITIEDATVSRPPPKVDAGVVRPPLPPPPKQTAAELTQLGIKDLGTGNFPGAVASFKKASAMGYPPAWRGLGIAYEKQGQAGAAITAYQRYLASAPGASDAQTIKDRIEKLKGGK